MNECETIGDSLPDLMNNVLPLNERAQVVEHLTLCDTCRRELAELYRFRRVLADGMEPVPEGIQNSAFDKLPPTPDVRIADIIRGSCELPVSLLRFSLSLVPRSIGLAAGQIQGAP